MNTLTYKLSDFLTETELQEIIQTLRENVVELVNNIIWELNLSRESIIETLIDINNSVEEILAGEQIIQECRKHMILISTILNEKLDREKNDMTLVRLWQCVISKLWIEAIVRALENGKITWISVDRTSYSVRWRINGIPEKRNFNPSGPLWKEKALQQALKKRKSLREKQEDKKIEWILIRKEILIESQEKPWTFKIKGLQITKKDEHSSVYFLRRKNGGEYSRSSSHHWNKNAFNKIVGIIAKKHQLNENEKRVLSHYGNIELYRITELQENSVIIESLKGKGILDESHTQDWKLKIANLEKVRHPLIFLLKINGQTFSFSYTSETVEAVFRQIVIQIWKSYKLTCQERQTLLNFGDTKLYSFKEPKKKKKRKK